MFVQEKGAAVSPEVLMGMRHLGTHGNRDGMGVMWVEKGRVQVEKKLAKTDAEVLEMYDRHKDKACAVHQRNQTKGKIDEENCHPFKVTSIDDGDPWDIWMMHNGTIQDVQVDAKMADSYNFATYFLRGFLKESPSAVRSFHFGRIVGGLVPRSKIILLSATGDPKDHGQYTIINTGEGRMLKPGIWVSRKEAIVAKEPISTPSSRGPVGYTPPFAAAQAKTQPEQPPLALLPATSPPTSEASSNASPVFTPVNRTSMLTPIKVGGWVMLSNGLKVFRVTDSEPMPAAIEIPPPDFMGTDNSPDIIENGDDTLDLSVLEHMSEMEIECVVEEQPSLAARLLHKLSRAF